MSRILRIGLPLFLVTLLLTSPALAAGVPGAGVSFGVKGGLNIAGVSNIEDEIGADDARTGLAFGAFMKANLGSVNLQVEGLYSQKGAKGIEYLGDNFMFELAYLDVPVLLRFDLPSPSVNVYFYAGPVFSILMSGEFVWGDESEDVKDDLKSTDIGLAFGAGIEMSKVSLELRYGMGLSTIVEDADPDMPDYKNKVISAMVGFTLF